MSGKMEAGWSKSPIADVWFYKSAFGELLAHVSLSPDTGLYRAAWLNDKLVSAYSTLDKAKTAVMVEYAVRGPVRAS